MLVKAQIKFIQSLQQKKYRNEHGLFFVEGKKTVQELLTSDLKPYKIYTTGSENFDLSDAVIENIGIADLKRISQHKNPSGVFGVFYIPEAKEINFKDWIVVLDDVRDPGNLGTIIRLCDWFGIQQLVCSEHTVDCYNPKVVQATMGSIARIDIAYVDLEVFLKDIKIPLYGAFMDGVSVHETELPKTGMLVLGNEANGISTMMEAIISEKVAIPQFGKKTTESLNVAAAAAILLNEIRRS